MSDKIGSPPAENFPQSMIDVQLYFRPNPDTISREIQVVNLGRSSGNARLHPFSTVVTLETVEPTPGYTLEASGPNVLPTVNALADDEVTAKTWERAAGESIVNELATSGIRYTPRHERATLPLGTITVINGENNGSLEDFKFSTELMRTALRIAASAYPGERDPRQLHRKLQESQEKPEVTLTGEETSIVIQAHAIARQALIVALHRVHRDRQPEVLPATKDTIPSLDGNFAFA